MVKIPGGYNVQKREYLLGNKGNINFLIAIKNMIHISSLPIFKQFLSYIIMFWEKTVRNIHIL